jgi:hypothetical protein
LRYSTSELSREFARLKRLYTECSRENRPGKRRFAFYEYLYEVYALHSSWRAAIGTSSFRAQIADLASRPMKPDQHLLKLIIDASCTADHKTRSRWAKGSGTFGGGASAEPCPSITSRTFCIATAV